MLAREVYAVLSLLSSGRRTYPNVLKASRSTAYVSYVIYLFIYIYKNGVRYMIWYPMCHVSISRVIVETPLEPYAIVLQLNGGGIQ